MSTHLLIAAAYLEDLPQGTKLVLMAVADSADEHTLEAAPGLPKLRAWSGLSKSRALGILAELKTAGYVEQIAAGRVGRRAVYRVFPAGVPPIPHPTEVAARYAEPVDNAAEEGTADATLESAPGSYEGPGRVLPVRPLHASTSVSSPRAPQQSTPRPPAAGFPGSRATDEDARGVARRARGALNVVCPLHSDQYVPCGRCAKAANEADPAAVAAAQKIARQLARDAAVRATTPKDTPA